MHYSNRDRTPPDVADIAELLSAERPTATPLELDRIKLRARQQATRSGPSLFTRQKGILMKSRLALTLMIVAGVMMSGTGATLAITGSSGEGSAAQSQYGQVSPNNEAGEPPAETLGDTAESTPVADTAQVEAASDDGGSLPFTGFLTIPLILGGVALLTAGAVLRRRTTGNHTA